MQKGEPPCVLYCYCFFEVNLLLLLFNANTQDTPVCLHLICGSFTGQGLVLFDEVEKAHPDVFNLMLQILEACRAQKV